MRTDNGVATRPQVQTGEHVQYHLAKEAPDEGTSQEVGRKETRRHGQREGDGREEKLCKEGKKGRRGERDER